MRTSRAPPGQEVALDVVHAALFDLALMLGFARLVRVDHEAVVLGALPVGVLGLGLIPAALGDPSLEVVQHHPLGHAAGRQAQRVDCPVRAGGGERTPLRQDTLRNGAVLLQNWCDVDRVRHGRRRGRGRPEGASPAFPPRMPIRIRRPMITGVRVLLLPRVQLELPRPIL